MNVVTELHKHVPVRICLEDVQLGGAGNVDNISLDLKDVSLKEVLDRVANAQSDVGWRTTTFLMCPIIHIFRRSSYEDARNPLNVTVSTFALNNDDLWDLPLLVYMNSSDFRNAVNPGGGNLSYAGSKIGGISLGKRIDIRYNVDM